MQRSLIKKFLLVILATSSLAASLFGEGDVIVRVVEDVTDASLEGATVVIPELNMKRATDRAGRATIRNLPDGEYTVTVSYRGLPDYTETFTVTSGEITSLPVRLGARAAVAEGEVMMLEELVAEAAPISSSEIAQQIERNAINVTDVLASDTMGQLPDRSVADAVRRLPGVSVERSSGQPQNEYVTIRGLYSDFNKVTVDGVAVTVSNADGASRSVPLNILSSSVADTIEVTKAVTPDMDGDAIGGSINIRTKNAFDYGERNISAEFGVSYTDIANDFSDLPYDEYNPSFSVSYSDFLDEDRTIGFNLSANYSKNLYAISEVGAGSYFLDGGLYFPEAVDLTEVLEEVERYGINASVEWRPDDYTTLTGKYSFSRADTIFERQRLSYFNPGFPDLAGATDDGQNYTGYTYTGFADKSVAYFEDRQDVHVLAFSGTKELDEWTLSGNLGINYSIYEEDPDESFRGTLTQFFDESDYEYTGGSYTPRVSNPFFDENDIDSYDYLLSADQITFDITDTEYSIGGDAERPFQIAGETVTFKFGAKARMRERDFGVTRRSFDDFDIFGNPDIPNLVADYEVDSRVDGAYGGSFYLDPQNFRRFVDSLEANEGLTTDPDDSLLEALAEYQAEENIYAAYAQGTWEYGNLTILAGARIEFTDVEFEGSEVDFDNLTVNSLTEGNDYVDILPGIHLRYDATDDFIIRGSINKTLARASYRQLNPSVLIEPDGPGVIVESGNIDLDPTESWNIDLGFDYYYSPSGYVSLGVFAKYMENNIYEQRRFVGDDTFITFENAETAEVYGVEFAIDQGFTSLPSYLSNLGASLNITLVDASVDTGLPGRGDDTPLFGQVETAVNASLYYDGDKFRARLSYNWSDDYLLVGGIDPDDKNLDEYADAYGTLDFSMGYYITKNIEIFFEAENITDEANRGYFGSEDRMSFNAYEGTTYFVGVNWNL